MSKKTNILYRLFYTGIRNMRSFEKEHAANVEFIRMLVLDKVKYEIAKSSPIPC